MIQVSATEFKTNFGKYLDLVAREVIHITKNGTAIAILTPPPKEPSWVDDITGIIPSSDIDIKQLKAERLAQKHENTD
jgi:antitoxin (DNA-binding transcriptional repressor) of toxin-antitoxin stability system